MYRIGFDRSRPLDEQYHGLMAAKELRAELDLFPTISGWVGDKGTQQAVDRIERRISRIKKINNARFDVTAAITHEGAAKGNRTSAKNRGWSNAKCRSAALKTIELLNERYPRWREGQGKRLPGSHGKGGIGAMYCEVCGLKNSDEARKYIHIGVQQLADRENIDALELLRKPWF